MGTASIASPGMQKVMLYVLPGMTGIFVLYMPAALQLTLTLTSVIAMSQAIVFNNPNFRRFVGIQPLPRREPPPPAPRDASPKKAGLGGMVSSFKSTFDEMVKAGQQATAAKNNVKETGQRRTAAELKHAEAYEEKRLRDIAQRRSESEQQKAVRRGDEIRRRRRR